MNETINILCYQTIARSNLRVYAPHARLDLERLLGLSFSGETLGSIFADFKATISFAVLGEVMIGVAMVYRLNDVHFIQNVAVLPQFRRMGIARKLVSMLIVDDRIAGGEDVFLASRDDNEAARGLYLSLSFNRHPIKVLGEDMFRLRQEDFVLPIQTYGSRIAMMHLPRD
jgi:ribosomal protein S18 acetylase RimI-like enzyme